MTPFEITFNVYKAGVRSTATFDFLAMSDAIHAIISNANMSCDFIRAQ